MKYEISRLWDSSMFDGVATLKCLERDGEISEGYEFKPEDGEYKNDLEKELLTGIVKIVLKKGSYDPIYDSDFRLGLDGILDVRELSQKHDKSEDDIIDNYLSMNSAGRERILSQFTGGTRLIDDVYKTEDRGRIGVIWFSGRDIVVYDFNSGNVIRKDSPGLGINYGSDGKRDFLDFIREREASQNQNLYLKDILGALSAIKDWDHYHFLND